MMMNSLVSLVAQSRWFKCSHITGTLASVKIHLLYSDAFQAKARLACLRVAGDTWDSQCPLTDP